MQSSDTFPLGVSESPFVKNLFIQNDDDIDIAPGTPRIITTESGVYITTETGLPLSTET